MTNSTLGGYRLVRKLGSGSRAEVFLGHPEFPARADRQVAIKMFRDTVEPSSIDRECTALDRATGSHCVRLLDLATDPKGRAALVLERLPRGPLGKVLAERPRLRLGECVTILAPVALALAELHGAGVTHGKIGLSSIGFREDGAPVILGFGTATIADESVTPASLATNPLVAADVDALAAVARAVLARAGEPAAEQLNAWLALPTAPESFPAELADRLFELAEPVAVSFVPATGPASASGVPGRVFRSEPVRVEPDSPSRSAALTSLHLPQWIEELVVSRLDTVRLAELWGKLRAALGAVRKPVWFVAATVAIALVVALAVVPPDQPATATSGQAPVVSTSPPIESGPVTGDDPLAALPDLLEARERCIAELSVLCLDTVDQVGSAALIADQELIRVIQDGGESPEPVRAGTLELVERLGNSALISLGARAETHPASVLLMKGEAGWRIRAWLE